MPITNKANKPAVKKFGQIAKAEGKALKAGLKAVGKSNRAAAKKVK